MLFLRLHYQRNESNALQRSGRKNYPYEFQNTTGIVWIAMNKQKPYGFAEPTQFLFVANKDMLYQTTSNDLGDQ